MMADACVILAAAAYFGFAMNVIVPGVALSIGATPEISASASAGSSPAPSLAAMSLSFINGPESPAK
jgi:hypothetical protein